MAVSCKDERAPNKSGVHADASASTTTGAGRPRCALRESVRQSRRVRKRRTPDAAVVSLSESDFLFDDFQRVVHDRAVACAIRKVPHAGNEAALAAYRMGKVL